MNTPQQHTPSIQEIRRSLCSQLIGAGLKTAPEIVDTAQALENFIYGGDKTEIKTTAKTEKKAEVKQEKTTEVVAEQESTAAEKEETTEQPTIEPAEVKAALMRVAKANRDAFLAIMAKFDAPNVPSIQPKDFQAVIAEVEKFEAENA